MVTEEAVLNALRKVQDPELHRDVVTLGMIQDLKISGDAVSLTFVLTTPACPIKAKFEAEVKAAVASVPGVKSVNLTTTAMVRPTRPFDTQGLAGIRNVIAIASGKGGVGKTTVSVNLAVALAQDGARVGLMDADIYGPNVPLMMGLRELPGMQGEKMIPAENFGVKVISMGFLIKPDDAVVWRGPMLHGAINKFLKEVVWGELDYLIVDLPPGTGDVQISLSQSIPLTGAVIVGTPQSVALQDVRRSIAMFQKVNVPIMGVIENMSTFICPHCQKGTDIFAKGGVRQAAEAMNLNFLGEIPLVPDIRVGADTGHPIVLTEPNSPASQALIQTARKVAGQASILAAQESQRFATVWKV